ncbi:MAG: hypothetical protein V8R14_05380 [Clostridia bacterium]
MKRDKRGLWVPDRKAFYGSCKSEAETEYQKYIERKNNGVMTNKCLGELIQEWIDNIFVESSLSTGTKYNYINAYDKSFPQSRLAGLQIGDVTALDLQMFYNELAESGTCCSSIKQMHNLLTHFYKYAELNRIGRNITTSVSVPNRDAVPAADKDARFPIWEDAELKAMINALEGTTMRFMIVLAVNTGARISELLALTYDDIRDGMLYINKQLSEKDPKGKAVPPHLDSTKSGCSNRVIPAV